MGFQYKGGHDLKYIADYCINDWDSKGGAVK